MSSEEIYGLVQVLQLYEHGMSNFYKGIRLSARGAKKGIEFSELKRMQIKMKLHYASQGTRNTMKIKDLEKLTGGQYDILNIPFEDEKNLINFYNRLKKVKVSFAELPDLCLGDGYTQIAYNPQDAEKVKLVVEYFKDKMEIEAAEISLEQYERMGGEKGKQVLDDLAAKGCNQEMHMDLLQRIRDRNASPEYIPISINLESLLISEKTDRYLLYVPGTQRKQTMEVKKMDAVLLDDRQNIYTHIKRGSEYEKYFSKKYDGVSNKRVEMTNRIRLDQTECLPDFTVGEGFDKDLSPKIKNVKKAVNLETAKGKISTGEYLPVSVNLNEQLVVKSPTMYIVKIPGSTKEDSVQLLSIPQKDAVLSSDGSTLTWYLKKGDTTNVQEHDVVTGKPKAEIKMANETLLKKYVEKKEPMRAVNMTEKDLLRSHLPKQTLSMRGSVK